MRTFTTRHFYTHFPVTRSKKLLKFTSPVIAAIFLTACGGGGGGGGNDSPPPSPLTLNLSNSNAITFSAIYPLAATPATQTISANVTGEGSGTLYVLVDFDGQAIKSISDVSISGNTGQASVTPPSPNDLGPGTFSSTIRIRACINDPTCATGQIVGSPKTIAVNYTVGATTPPDSAMPHVLTAGRAGSLILRGSGMANVTSVQIGGVQATSITTVSDTEVHASYPTLTSGSKSITLNGGSILFNGSVVVVPAPSLPSANLAFPQTPARVASLVYDAEREAILVSGVFPNRTDNVLWRYTVSAGIWTLTTATTIPDLNDIELSADGTRVIVVAGNSVQELDADTLSQITTALGPALPPSAQLTGLAITNDGSAIISSGTPGSSGTLPWFNYSVGARTFKQIQTLGIYSHDLIAPPMITTIDGAHVFLTPTPSFHSPILDYVASSGRLKSSATAARQPEDQPVAISTNGSLTIPYTDNFLTQAFDLDGNLLGTITDSVDSKVVIVNPQGTRAYVYKKIDNQLHTYDLTSGTFYNEIGTGIGMTLPIPDMSYPVKTAVTPDGSTICIAGIGGLVVMSAP